MKRLTAHEMHVMNGGSVALNCHDLADAIAVLALLGQVVGAGILLGYYISQGC